MDPSKPASAVVLGDAGSSKFTLTDTELDLTTTTTLQLDVVNTGAIKVNGVTRSASRESLFRIVLTGDATIGTTDSNFTSALDVGMATALTLTLSVSVTTSSETTLLADSACSTADVLSIAAGKTLTSANKDVSLTVTNGALDGGLDAGTGHVFITAFSVCPLQIGANVSSALVDITETEVDLITTMSGVTLTSKTITVRPVGIFPGFASILGRFHAALGGLLNRMKPPQPESSKSGKDVTA
jgi:hypothetical protein